MITTQIEKIDTVKGLQKLINEVKKQNKTVGFVPTMGALHSGHLKLVKKAKKECDFVIVSIFVNPTQFNNKDDFANYPETIEKDIEFLEEFANAVFTPSVDEVYLKSTLKKYSFTNLESVMEGPSRPGHFNGVSNVVHRLFEIVKPDYAYFGEKDFQQLCIIKKLVEIENIPVEIIPVETERSPEGLALSSRNIRLSKEGLLKATLIHKNLNIIKDGLNTSTTIKKLINDAIYSLEIENFKVEYLEIRDEENLSLLKQEEIKNTKKNYRVFIVAWIEGVRLIDNIKL